jgi:hypothetical protein
MMSVDISIDEMFDIIKEFPNSTAAIEDLKVYPSYYSLLMSSV